MKNFGKRLKKIRNEYNITQDSLAEYLDISFQAVSKWENGKGFPDISLLPAISNFFGVSADYLLGIDLEKSEDNINKIISEADIYTHTGEIEKSIKIINEGLQIFPNDHKLLSKWIGYNVMAWDDSRSIEEIEAKGNLILRDCTIDKIRHETIYNLAFAYCFSGNKEKVAQMAELLPDNPYSKEQILCFSVEPKDRLELKSKCILREAELLLVDILCISKHHIVFGNPENAFDVINRVLEIIKNIGEEGFLLYFKAEAYKDLALAYGKIGKADEMFEAMDKVYESYIYFEKAIETGHEYVSPLIKGLYFDKEVLTSTSTKNSFEWYYDLITHSKTFKIYRNDIRYTKILEKLKLHFKA